jgi:hypothetical protein
MLFGSICAVAVALDEPMAVPLSHPHVHDLNT